ncbi:hypothetical protein D3C72_1655170 [compost metagenome]
MNKVGFESLLNVFFSQFNFKRTVFDAQDFSEFKASVRAERAFYQLLVIHTMEPATKETARECCGHLFFQEHRALKIFSSLSCGDSFVKASCRCGYVFRSFKTAFDFEAINTSFQETWDFVDAAKVLRRNQEALATKIAFFTIDMHLVIKATALRALAAIRRSAADTFGSKALSRIAHTQSTVNKDFDFFVGVLFDGLNFF